MSGNVFAEGKVTREDSKGFPIEVSKDSLERKMFFSKQESKLGQKVLRLAQGLPEFPGISHSFRKYSLWSDELGILSLYINLAVPPHCSS